MYAYGIDPLSALDQFPETEMMPTCHSGRSRSVRRAWSGERCPDAHDSGWGSSMGMRMERSVPNQFQGQRIVSSLSSTSN